MPGFSYRKVIWDRFKELSQPGDVVYQRSVSVMVELGKCSALSPATLPGSGLASDAGLTAGSDS
jgi:hypothetical protein